jgi:hypothetical protein
MLPFVYLVLLVALGSVIVGASSNVLIKFFVGCLFSSALFVLLNALTISDLSAQAIFYGLGFLALPFLLKKIWITRSSYFEIQSVIKIEALIIVLCILSIALNAYHYPMLAGDALAYWYQKGKFLMYWKPLPEWPTLGYPNLSSGVWYLVFLTFGDSEYIGRLFFALIVLLGFWGAYIQAMQKDEKKPRNIIRFLFCYYAILFSIEKMGGDFRFSNSGYMDYYLGFSVCFTFFLILHHLQDRGLMSQSTDLRLYSLFFLLGLSANIKAEGYILVGLLTTCILCYLYVHYRWRRFLPFVCIILVTCIGASFYKILLIFSSITPPPAQVFEIHYQWVIDRIATVSWRVGTQLVYDYEFWAPFAAYVFISKNKVFALRHWMFLIPIGGWIAFLFLVYTTTTMPYEWHIDTSLNRLLFQMYFYLPFLILFIEMSPSDSIRNNDQKNY